METTEIIGILADVGILVALILTAWQLAQAARTLRETRHMLRFQAYNEAMDQLVRLKYDFMVDPETIDSVFEVSDIFRKARGDLPPRAFLNVCKAFFHIERVCLLRYNEELTTEEWKGVANGVLPYLGLPAFGYVYRAHIKPDESHHPEFLRVLEGYYDGPSDPGSLPDPLELRRD